MLRQLRPALVLLLAFTVLTGVAYPLLTTGVAQLAFGDAASGSRLTVDGEVVGSSLIAQPFEGEQWFQPRPSAVGYDAAGSGGSNLGPSNPDLLAEIEARAEAYRRRNGLGPGTAVPVDAVTASGSGLDPHISPRNARLQTARVAEARGLEVAAVAALVEDHTEARTAGILGEPRVNVVELNAALAQLAR
jgi:K+-transporting ATPase ATPase C chain